MNIFYFNITYTCNSNCVFCYSHNTIHSGQRNNEIEVRDFIEYLIKHNLQPQDRVIINGGEPFLHSNIIGILRFLLEIGCEVLIYTNGRCLKGYDFKFITDKYRFVIPVHGYRRLHDEITRCPGSFDSMSEGIKYLHKYNCKVDIKVILNPKMMSSDTEFNKTLHEIDLLEFNNAVHITKMADTIVSKRNNILSVTNETASKYTMLLFDHFKTKDVIIKTFDTCVKDINITDFEDRNIVVNVHFKDANTAWNFNLNTPYLCCRKKCSKTKLCRSAIGDYTVLEYNGKFYKNIE